MNTIVVYPHATGGEITLSIPREPTVKVALEPLTLREKRSPEDQNAFTDTFFVDIDKDFDPEVGTFTEKHILCHMLWTWG